MRLVCCSTICVLVCASPAARAAAGAEVARARNAAEDASPAFRFPAIPPPAADDAAAGAAFVLVDGQADPNGGGLDKLHDGHLPWDPDDPAENFFFAAGTPGGRIRIDLAAASEIRQVNTYSWHPGSRGPQVYRLYGSDGLAPGFKPAPPRDTDPARHGWTLLATVDTRPPEGDGGGQYGVSLAGLGRQKHLLLDIAATETRDPFGATFFSEIDVVTSAAPAVAATPAPKPGRLLVAAEGGQHWICFDLSDLTDPSDPSDLSDWVARDLAPVVRTWYPKIVALLPSDGYRAPRRLDIVFDKDMEGVAATGGTRIRAAAKWIRGNLQGEARGAIVHELVHVVQAYGQARRGGPRPAPAPGWLVEGLADYVRWFLYEPESRGAEIGPRQAARVRYDEGYRVSANFLNWVTKKHGRDVVAHLNAALREGRYREELWIERTGATLPDLGAQWKAALPRPTP